MLPAGGKELRTELVLLRKNDPFLFKQAEIIFIQKHTLLIPDTDTHTLEYKEQKQKTYT